MDAFRIQKGAYCFEKDASCFEKGAFHLQRSPDCSQKAPDRIQRSAFRNKTARGPRIERARGSRARPFYAAAREASSRRA